METNKDKEYVKKSLKLIINTYNRERRKLNKWYKECELLEEDEEKPVKPMKTVREEDVISALRQLSKIDGLDKSTDVNIITRTPKFKLR